MCVCFLSFYFQLSCPDHASCVFHSIVCSRSFSSSTHASCITLFLPVQEAFVGLESRVFVGYRVSTFSCTVQYSTVLHAASRTRPYAPPPPPKRRGGRGALACWRDFTVIVVLSTKPHAHYPSFVRSTNVFDTRAVSFRNPKTGKSVQLYIWGRGHFVRITHFVYRTDFQLSLNSTRVEISHVTKFAKPYSIALVHEPGTCSPAQFFFHSHQYHCQEKEHFGPAFPKSTTSTGISLYRTNRHFATEGGLSRE